MAQRLAGRNLMKTKIFALVLILQLFWFNPAAAAVILQEDFEGSFPPTGWSRVIHSGSCNWESTATTGRTNHTNGSGSAADADSDWCGSGMDASLLTPAFSLVGTTNPVLRFQNDFSSFGTVDDAYVDISLDGGTNWTTLLHYDGVDVGPNLVEIDLSAYVGQASLLIRFHYVAPGWDWYWLVDDVIIEDPSTYPVTYDGNGNTGGAVPVDASSPYVAGATVTVLGNTGSLVRDGFTFNGWNTAADGSGDSYVAGDTFTMPAADVTLYAQWTAVSPAAIPTLSEWGMIIFALLMAGIAVMCMRRRKDMTA